jgi:tRNA(fMet)-specific endonuclease VapC
VCLSALSLSELRFGAEKRRSKRLHRLIDTFVTTVDVVPFDAVAAAQFGRLCASLEGTGTPIGVMDTLIAAHAMSLHLTLVSNNTKHFTRVKGLKTLNWLHDAG